MLTLGPLAFTAPWLLVGLAALPILWLILRAVPPAPIRRRFPGVALLLGLKDDDSQTDRTPWWLLLLRILAVAAVITGFAGPILNPQPIRAGDGPLLILADGTWADARDWAARRDRIADLLSEAQRQGRPTAVIALTNVPATGPDFTGAEVALATLPNFTPSAWEPDATALATWADQMTGSFDTFWLSDGLARDSRADLLAALETHGQVTVFQSPRQTFGLRPVRYTDGKIIGSAVRTPVGGATEVTLAAIGLDPSGIERQLAGVPLTFAPGDAIAEVEIALPPELRNRVSRFEISGLASAGAVSLVDDSLRRREVALVSGAGEAEGLQLLSPLHYLREALAPTADLIDGAAMADILLANPDVIILADVATLSEDEAAEIGAWVEKGGLLVRFAGPRLAASDLGRAAEDPLMPVRLRAGGRSVGGAMSWGEPKALAAFPEGSPFFGLPVPDDVTVTSQVVAQPDPTLSDRVIAQLADGTPLVTRKSMGEGQVILFHVTANAEWSTLPLSGLFVQMLERLAITSGGPAATTAELEGTTWLPEAVLDAYGTLQQTDTLPGVAGEKLATGTPGPDLQPGLYAGEDRRIAVNVINAETTLAPAAWPARLAIEGMDVIRETPLKGWLLALALVILALDVLASLALSGKLRGPRAATVAGLVALLALPLVPGSARADSADDFAQLATSEVVLAHVLTGDAQIDEAARAGLAGLSTVIAQRTTVEPAAPIGVNIETDELSFFPLLYWPVTPDMTLPSREAYVRLNRFLATGGMIVFDTRDADIGGFGSGTAEGRRLQAIARGLDIPPIEPIPSDHVLTRSFYLLQDFPGRWASPDIWVEASPPDAELAEGMPFRNLNDGVSPVIIGGNDWAAAWATGPNGQPLYPVGRGLAGERQREIAYRFGVNLVMYVLTGNYKSDQVHVPELLDRLGQ